MADDLKSPEARLLLAGRHVAEWTATRDQLIQELRASGMSFREIAMLAGLSHTRVQQIVQGTR